MSWGAPLLAEILELLAILPSWFLWTTGALLLSLVIVRALLTFLGRHGV